MVLLQSSLSNVSDSKMLKKFAELIFHYLYIDIYYVGDKECIQYRAYIRNS